MVDKKNILRVKVSNSIGINVDKCYQCGKCSAGCPVSGNMDFTSSVMMRMIQIGEEIIDKQILRSQTIWVCISCGICLSRCPMEIDIPEIIDYLRQCSLEKKMQNKKSERNIIPFHYSFLNSIKYTGRIYEIGVAVEYKLRTFNFFQDLSLAFYMFIKGKLPLFPNIIKNRKHLSFFFKKYKK
ncbi:MAG: (Fe-S)-binding protein [Bacteroidales bacterium OttesenSCG-928-I14]|jgi:heterodisulfide reductase subunit C|nr:(Fe-S)-binding protein [Bacteroidales bacterium OttesenSCG-928-I14]